MTPRDQSWTPDMDSRLRALWRQGLHDTQIATAMLSTVWTVAARRRDLCLPAHRYAGHTPEIRERIRQASLERHRDASMAQRMLAGLAKGREIVLAQRRLWQG